MDSDLQEYLPLMKKLLKYHGYYSDLLDDEDFYQSAFVEILRDRKRNPDGRRGTAAQVIHAGFIEAFRKAGLTERRAVPEAPCVHMSAVALRRLIDRKQSNWCLYPENENERRMEEKQRRVLVKKLLKRIPPREAMVFRALSRGVSQRTLMRQLHRSEGKISQIKSSAIAHLRALIHNDRQPHQPTTNL